MNWFKKIAQSEEWKEIPQYPFLKINEDGLVQKKAYNGQWKSVPFKKNKGIYKIIDIKYDNKRIVMNISQMVAKLFRPKQWFKGCVVKFKDGNPWNTNVNNLRIISKQDHARENGAKMFGSSLNNEDLGRQWKTIQGYPNYRINQHGDIQNIKDNGEVLRNVVGDTLSGYRQVVLYNSEGKKKFMVSQLVAMMFVPQWYPGCAISYKDGDIMNSDKQNLVIRTKSQVSVQNGQKMFGENNGSHKLKQEQVIKIRDLYQKGIHGIKDLSKMFNVSDVQIGNIVKGLHWKHM